MKVRRTAWTLWTLSLVLACLVAESGCRSGEYYRLQAEGLYAEAEDLRLAFEKEASELAIGKYRDALEAWEQSGNKADAARAAHGIGETHWQMGALEEALEAYLEALSLSREAEDPVLENQIRSDAGVAYGYLGDLELGSEECQQALELARQLGSAAAEARALNCQGEVSYHRGDSNDALELYRQAEPLWRSANDRHGQAETLFYLGSALTDLDDLDGASRYLDEALSLWTEVGDKRGIALTLNALGRVQFFRAEYQSALNRFTESRAYFRTAGDALSEATSITGMASIYDEMAEAQDALRYWLEALDRFEVAGLQMASVEVLVYVADGHMASDVASALGWLEEALALAEESGNRHMESYALRYIGSAHLALGEPEEALEHLERSLEVQRFVEDPRFEAKTLADVGRAHELMGDLQAAATHFDRSLDLSEASLNRVGQAVSLFGLARTSRGLNQLDAARNFVERALEVAESLRTEVESQQLRASYFDSVHEYHKLHVDVLMRLDKTRPGEDLAAAAFKASERARARSLLENLVEAGVDVRTGVDRDLLERERSLEQLLASSADRQMQLSGEPGGEAELAALSEEIRDLIAQHDQVRAEIRSRSPHYAALTQPQPLGLREVQEQVLDGRTVLLEYALGEQSSYVWAVSSEEYSSHELPPRTTIEETAWEVHELLTARLPVEGESVRDYRLRVRDAENRYWEAAARLGEMLLGPVTEAISGKRILIVSDGALQHVPFAALPAPGKDEERVPLIVEHEIVNLPSASTLAVLRQEMNAREQPPMAIAVLADPVFEADDPRLRRDAEATQPREMLPESAPSSHLEPVITRALRDVGILRQGTQTIARLMSTRQEAEAILATAPQGTTFKATDFDASRATAMDPALGRYRIVHFATHGLIDSESPGLSGIILSMFDENGEGQDGFLRLHDIYNLELPVELVVLSACNSALGKQVRGEGLVGLVRGFMYAGSKRVVASLWKVEDAATAELMTLFYQQMLVENRTPAAALRHAQITMWRETQWKSPFFWAAFVLQGEWR